MRKKSQYYKVRDKKTNIVNTVKIVLTALVISLTGIIISCGIAYGWQSIIDFFKGSFFCAILLIVLTATCIGMWILSLASNARKVKEDD